LRRLAAVLTGLAGALLASAAIGPAAWAEIPADGGSAPIQTSAVAGGGMPGWQITLIALGAAIVAAAAAVLLDRARASARSPLSPHRGAFRPAARS
jgi:hypothetical protein